MRGQKPPSATVGYTRQEFNAIFRIYARFVYEGLFRDFSFAEHQGRFFISFCEEAGRTPLISIEKQPLGSGRALFVATFPVEARRLAVIARSEKIDSFARQLTQKIETIRLVRQNKDGKGNKDNKIWGILS